MLASWPSAGQTEQREQKDEQNGGDQCKYWPVQCVGAKPRLHCQPVSIEQAILPGRVHHRADAPFEWSAFSLLCSLIAPIYHVHHRAHHSAYYSLDFCSPHPSICLLFATAQTVPRLHRSPNHNHLQCSCLNMLQLALRTRNGQ